MRDFSYSFVQKFLKVFYSFNMAEDLKCSSTTIGRNAITSLHMYNDFNIILQSIIGICLDLRKMLVFTFSPISKVHKIAGFVL